MFLYLHISDDGKTTSFYEYIDNQWIKYEDYPAVLSNYSEEYRGKIFTFSSIYDHIYDWIDNDGYTNFGDWVEKEAPK